MSIIYNLIECYYHYLKLQEFHNSHFRFTAKFPKVITFDKRLKDVEKELELFFFFYGLHIPINSSNG
jgi:uncharacterized protein YecE (DUF72 family)